MGRLFEDRRRTDTSPSRPGEAAGTFLGRSANPVFASVRELMSAWHSHLPPGAQRDSARRLTGSDEGNFRSAWAELYTHAVLSHLGFSMEDHPAMSTSDARPDYLARRGDETMLVEVTVLGDGEDPGAPRRAAVIEGIGKVQHPDFDVHVEITAEGDSSPSMRPVRAQLERWLSDLDWSPERPALEAGARPSRRLFSSGEWRIEFEAFAKPPERRGDGQTLVSGPTVTRVYDHPGALLQRLTEKASKYGELDEALLLVVHTDRFSVSREDVDGALHGRTVGRLDPNSGRALRTGERTPGLWRSERQPVRPQVSGVLVLSQELAPWSVSRLQPTLWRNPDARRALPDLPFGTLLRRGEKLEEQPSDWEPAALPGADGEALGADWPGDPWPVT